MSLVSIINQNEYVYEFPVHVDSSMTSYNNFYETLETSISNSDDLNRLSDDPNTDFYASFVKNCTLDELNMICGDYNINSFYTCNNSDNVIKIKTETMDQRAEELHENVSNVNLDQINGTGINCNEVSLHRPQRNSVIKYHPQILPPTKQIVKRSYKLWEFLRNLLLDSRTCPSLIKWEDPSQGTFKFVQSEKVAQLWGQRKKNHRMNYEKLSRAMRYYYRSKVLLPVIGKRLVYKFGPFATGWRTENPIL